MRKLFITLFSLLFVACSGSATAGRAEYEQGVKYLQGIGIEKNAEKAIELLTRASDLGSAKAQLALGYLYLRGTGVEKDEGVALRLFRRAATQGERDAQYNTALAYVKGIGTKIDFPEALKWFTEAAMQDDSGSQFNLGLMYLNGEGVVRDPLTAFAWFSIAAENGYVGAKGTREFARQALSVDQLNEAQAVIKKLRSRIRKPAVSGGIDVSIANQPL